MAAHSKIEWTTHTFNIVWGCTKVSPACDHCYAETFAKRVGFQIWGQEAPRRTFGDAHWDEPHRWNRKALQRGVRERVFCGSMCDVMEDRRELDPWRERLYPLIQETPALDWLLLTKRPQNFHRFFPQAWRTHAQPNVWGLTTVESADYGWRIDALLDMPFVIRGLSVEPLLGPLDLTPWFKRGGLHWVIIGGESGPGSRPFDMEWARSLVRQCREAGVACFVKQLGALPVMPGVQEGKLHPRIPLGFQRVRLTDAKGGDIDEFPAELRVRQVPQP